MGRHRLPDTHPDQPTDPALPATPPLEVPEVFTRRFWLDVADRAVKTSAQSVAVAWGVTSATGTVDAFALDWRLAAGAAAGGALLSLITSIASAAIGPRNTPSVI